jgi:ubiquitin carboxyl-terminal hydrolase 9/24
LDRLETAIKGTPQANTIQYHFGGTYANVIICKTCPHTFERMEDFLSLGVPVKNKKTIYEGLEAFIAGDMLTEDNQYKCDKCDKKVDALKRLCIKKLPRYMIMTLKRFEFDFDQMIRVKVNDHFEFPLDLDMTPYT